MKYTAAPRRAFPYADLMKSGVTKKLMTPSISKKNIIYFLLLILLLIILFYIRYKFTKEKFENSEFENKLSLLAIFKNETMNLKVWVDHYLWQGVEKIYLIDNGSTDEPLKILQPYIDKKQVIYYDLPERHKQPSHYRHVVEKENLKQKTKWLILCDLDEFYYTPTENLKDILIKDYEKYDIIYSNWYMFGNDGLINHPEDIRKSIVMRSPEVDVNTKCIFKPSKLKNIKDINIHDVNNMNNKIIENEKIRLNHYPIQSLEFYQKVKMTRGDGDSIKSDNVRDMNYFNKYNENKSYKDTLLKDLIEKM
jgi:hypothetical protein